MKSEAVKVLGTTDEVTTCECCGKANLRGTVAISINGGSPVFFGVVCAAKSTGRTEKGIKGEASQADRAKARAEAAADEARREAEQQPWFDFLARVGKGSTIFEKIKSLGGFAAARALFNQEAK